MYKPTTSYPAEPIGTIKFTGQTASYCTLFAMAIPALLKNSQAGEFWRNSEDASTNKLNVLSTECKTIFNLNKGNQEALSVKQIFDKKLLEQLKSLNQANPFVWNSTSSRLKKPVFLDKQTIQEIKDLLYTGYENSKSSEDNPFANQWSERLEDIISGLGEHTSPQIIKTDAAANFFTDFGAGEDAGQFWKKAHISSGANSNQIKDDLYQQFVNDYITLPKVHLWVEKSNKDKAISDNITQKLRALQLETTDQDYVCTSDGHTIALGRITDPTTRQPIYYYANSNTGELNYWDDYQKFISGLQGHRLFGQPHLEFLFYNLAPNPSPAPTFSPKPKDTAKPVAQSSAASTSKPQSANEQFDNIICGKSFSEIFDKEHAKLPIALKVSLLYKLDVSNGTIKKIHRDSTTVQWETLTKAEKILAIAQWKYLQILTQQQTSGAHFGRFYENEFIAQILLEEALQTILRTFPVDTSAHQNANKYLLFFLRKKETHSLSSPSTTLEDTQAAKTLKTLSYTGVPKEFKNFLKNDAYQKIEGEAQWNSVSVEDKIIKVARWKKLQISQPNKHGPLKDNEILSLKDLIPALEIILSQSKNTTTTIFINTNLNDFKNKLTQLYPSSSKLAKNTNDNEKNTNTNSTLDLKEKQKVDGNKDSDEEIAPPTPERSSTDSTTSSQQIKPPNPTVNVEQKTAARTPLWIEKQNFFAEERQRGEGGNTNDSDSDTDTSNKTLTQNLEALSTAQTTGDRKTEAINFYQNITALSQAMADNYQEDFQQEATAIATHLNNLLTACLEPGQQNAASAINEFATWINDRSTVVKQRQGIGDRDGDGDGNGPGADQPREAAAKHPFVDALLTHLGGAVKYALIFGQSGVVVGAGLGAGAGALSLLPVNILFGALGGAAAGFVVGALTGLAVYGIKTAVVKAGFFNQNQARRTITQRPALTPTPGEQTPETLHQKTASELSNVAQVARAYTAGNKS